MISIEEIKKAREVIQATVVHTPVLELELPDQKTNLFLKCENLQLSGSFKVRGALYRMSQLSAQEKENGVIACLSSEEGRCESDNLYSFFRIYFKD